MAKGYRERGRTRDGKRSTRKDIDPGSKIDLQRALVFALAFLAQHMGQGTADRLLGLAGHPEYRAHLEATRSLIMRLASVMSGNGNMQECIYPFTIGDSYDHTKKHEFGIVKYGGVGLSLKVDGYGEKNAEDGLGYPVYLEIRNGVPYLVVWSDINSEDPTHIISLEDAAESKRIKDNTEEGEIDGQIEESQEASREEDGV